MKARILKPTPGELGIISAGTIINHPDCFRLVEVKIAEPADEDCYVLVKSRGKVRFLPDRKDLIFVPDPPADWPAATVSAQIERPVADSTPSAELVSEVTSYASRQNETPGCDSETSEISD